MRCVKADWLSNNEYLILVVEQLLWLGCTVPARRRGKEMRLQRAHCLKEIKRISASMIAPHVMMKCILLSVVPTHRLNGAGY
jgi:hypothetical protein